MNDLVISLRLDGLNPAMGGLNHLAQRIQSLPSPAQQFARGSATAGPFARFQQANQRHLQAIQQGSALEVADAKVQLIRAQRAADRARRDLQGGPSFMDRLSTFARSTRFGGGGLNPLIGRSLDLFGGGKLAGPALIAGAALTGLAAATKTAIAALQEVSMIRYQAGSSLSDAARARAIGGFLGIDMGAFAEQLANRLATDRYAMGFGSRIGITDYQGDTPYGKMDRLRNVFKLLDQLTKMPEAQAVQYARAMGAESLLRFRDLDPAQAKRLQESLKVLGSPERVRQMAALDAELIILKNNFTSLSVALIPLLKLLNEMIPKTVGAEEYIDKNKRNPGFNLGYWIGDQIMGLLGMEKPKKQKEQTAMEKHTEAMNQHATALRGVIGGGNRAQNAVPAGWRGTYGAYKEMNSFWENEAKSLGAFTV